MRLVTIDNKAKSKTDPNEDDIDTWWLYTVVDWWRLTLQSVMMNIEAN